MKVCSFAGKYTTKVFVFFKIMIISCTLDICSQMVLITLLLAKALGDRINYFKSTLVSFCPKKPLLEMIFSVLLLYVCST